jgi:hypothetical protein
MINPFTASDLGVRRLADKINDLKELLYLFPDTPKQEAFGPYFSRVQRPVDGYVASFLETKTKSEGGYDSYEMMGGMSSPCSPSNPFNPFSPISLGTGVGSPVYETVFSPQGTDSQPIPDQMWTNSGVDEMDILEAMESEDPETDCEPLARIVFSDIDLEEVLRQS